MPIEADHEAVSPARAAAGDGVFHESLGHECLKSSLAFRKPATAVASRRPLTGLVV